METFQLSHETPIARKAHFVQTALLVCFRSVCCMRAYRTVRVSPMQKPEYLRESPNSWRNGRKEAYSDKTNLRIRYDQHENRRPCQPLRVDVNVTAISRFGEIDGCTNADRIARRRLTCQRTVRFSQLDSLRFDRFLDPVDPLGRVIHALTTPVLVNDGSRTMSDGDRKSRALKTCGSSETVAEARSLHAPWARRSSRLRILVFD